MKMAASQMVTCIQQDDGQSVLVDDQSWADAILVTMLAREALNMKENDTVCAASFCTEPFDQLPIMPMRRKSIATGWLRF